MVIGTVQGDLHDIGKNLVASMLEGGGFEVVDLGVDVPPEKFVEAAKEKDGTIVALSALLTTTMTMMKRVIEALEKAGVRRATRVMIGGAPITQQYADEIGADGYSDNARPPSPWPGSWRRSNFRFQISNFRFERVEPRTTRRKRGKLINTD